MYRPTPKYSTETRKLYIKVLKSFFSKIIFGWPLLIQGLPVVLGQQLNDSSQEPLLQTCANEPIVSF